MLLDKSKNGCWINILMIISSILLGLGFLEILLSFANIDYIERFVYQYNVPIIQYTYGKFHPILGYTLQPDLQDINIRYKDKLNYTISTNGHGFRGQEWDLNPKRKNIVIIGDSYAMGWGEEWSHTFGQLLESKLWAKDRKYQVVNLAISGYFLDQVINDYILYGKQFNPVCVIYLFCYNDLLEIPPHKNGSYDIKDYRIGGSVQEFNKIARKNNVFCWSFERAVKGSYLNAFWHLVLLPGFNKKIGVWTRPLNYVNLAPPVYPSKPVPIDNDSKKYLLFGLQKLHMLAQGRPIILMSTSHRMRLHLRDRKSSYRWILRDFANVNQNVYFADFESKMRELSDGVPVFFSIDGHWNENGHKLASQMFLNIMINDIGINVKD